MTRKGSRVETIVYGYSRLSNTRNGNPRYRFYTNDGDYLLSSDAGYGYEVTNHPFPRRAVLILTAAGRVTDIEEIECADPVLGSDDPNGSSAARRAQHREVTRLRTEHALTVARRRLTGITRVLNAP